MMRHRLIGSAILVALLTGLGFLFRSSAGDQPLPCQQHLQKTFLQDQEWVQERVSDTLLPGYFSSAKELRYLNETQDAVERLDEWDRQGVSLFLFEGDSLLIWTGRNGVSSDVLNNEFPVRIGTSFWQQYPVKNGLTWVSRIEILPSSLCPTDQFSISEGGKEMYSLAFPAFAKKNKSTPPIAFTCFGLALLMSLLMLYSFSARTAKSKSAFLGIFAWLAGLFALVRLGTILTGSVNPNHWLLHPIWPSGLLGPTVIDWLWQSFLLLLSMTLYFRFVQFRAITERPLLSHLLAGFQFLATGGFFLANLRCFQVLVEQSNEWLQVDNIFHLNNYTFGTIAGIGMWWLAFFLFAIRNTSLSRSLVSSQNRRVLLMIVASIVLLPLTRLVGLSLPDLVVLALLCIFLPLFDYYFERDTTNLTWFFIWLIFFGMLSAGALYVFNLEKDRNTMVAYAKKLAPPNDPVLQNRIRAYATDSSAGETFLNRVLSDQYIQKYYQPDFFRRPTVPPSDSATNRFFQEPTGQGGNRLWIFGPGDTLSIVRPLQPVAFFRPYQDMTEIPAYRSLHNLDRYQFLVIQDQRLVDQQGNPSRSLFSRINQMETGQVFSTLRNQRLSVLYRYDDQRWVLMERSLGIYLVKPLSLFAFLFLVMLGLCILFALAIPLLGLSQGTIVNLFSSAKSLRTKIQLTVLALIICSFGVIAMLTIFSFQRSSTKEQETRLLQRVASMRTGLQTAIRNNPAVLTSSETLDSLSRELLQEYRLDVNLYNRKGRWIAGSNSNRTNARLPDLMASEAFESLRSGLEEYRLVSEQLGAINFKTVYVPLQERSTLYLGVPYYAQNQEMQNDLYDFMGTLFSVYAFTLLIAAAVTVYVSKWITKPLDHIREGLGNLRLGSNEPLAYEGTDEIGELVREYNVAIHKLEESTELLRKSERESAWREMAKQVAHEIKNPLTPMKLRIQHLMRAYQQDPEQAAPMVKKVSNSLIEQIDTLTRIANEFSRFAKMPKPQNVDFDLQRLLESVTTVFSEEDAGRVLFASDLATAPVHADRDHLTRVFNNLIKNGLQAIPDHRQGLIRVTLTQGNNLFLVTVTDNGKGIPEDIQHKVFSPNFTTKSSGTGLGLAMSRQMIEQAGGRIYFETEPEVGTTFFVEIPESGIRF